MVIITYAHGHGFRMEAFESFVDAQEFINELFTMGIDFEVKFR